MFPESIAISLLFTGHMIDLPDRPEPRFPASLEPAARERIGAAIELAVSEDVESKVIETIMRTAQTGQIGDGKIFTHKLVNVIRIRTGEQDSQAL